jgi:hypothetical protein
MATLAELQARLDCLREARASGAREIETQTGPVRRRVAYRTDDELEAAIADLERQIAAASGPPVRTIYVNASKGI